MRVVAQRSRGVDIAGGVRVSLRINVEVDRGGTLGGGDGKGRRLKLDRLLASDGRYLDGDGFLFDRGASGGMEVTRRRRWVRVVLQLLTARRPYLRLDDVDPRRCRLLFGAPWAASLGVDRTEAVELSEDVVDV